MKTYDVTPHENLLNKTVLMMDHNLNLFGIWKIYPETMPVTPSYPGL